MVENIILSLLLYDYYTQSDELHFSLFVYAHESTNNTCSFNILIAIFIFIFWQHVIYGENFSFYQYEFIQFLCYQYALGF